MPLRPSLRINYRWLILIEGARTCFQDNGTIRAFLHVTIAVTAGATVNTPATIWCYRGLSWTRGVRKVEAVAAKKQRQGKHPHVKSGDDTDIGT